MPAKTVEAAARAVGRYPIALLEQQASTRVPERDYQSLVDAVRSGRITAEPGL